MLKIKPIHTGSTGNSFIVSDGKSHLMLDCGLDAQLTHRWANENKFDITKINAILGTHIHKDHVGGMYSHYTKWKIPLYTSQEVWEFKRFKMDKIFEHQKNFLKAQKITKIGNFAILPFRTHHGNYIDEFFKESHAYLINNKYNEKLVYLTDTGATPSKVKNAHCYIIECNHDRDLLFSLLEQGIVDEDRIKRLTSDSGHFDIKYCINYLKDCVGDKTETVILMHLGAHSNRKEYENRVKAALPNNIKVVALESNKLLNEEFIVGYQEKENPF